MSVYLPNDYLCLILELFFCEGRLGFFLYISHILCVPEAMARGILYWILRSEEKSEVPFLFVQQEVYSLFN